MYARRSTSRSEYPLIGRIVQTMAEEIGPRPATSAAEARAAAIMAAQMRQIGFDVSVHPFSAAAAPSIGLGLLAAVGFVAGGLGGFAPWPSLALVVVALALAIRELNGPPHLAALLRRQPSQNVVGTRAAEGIPSQRIVLLCHLDTPRVSERRWRGYLRWRLLAVPIGLALLGSVIILHGLNVIPAWVITLPLIVLGGALLVIIRRERSSHWATGAVDAAGIGVAIATAATLRPLTDLEVWLVGLGAGAASGAGLEALLATYPFPADETLFINIPWVGRGALTLVAGEGLWRKYQAEESIVGLFHELRSYSAQLDRRSYRGEQLVSTRLLKRGFRAVSLIGLQRDGTAAGFRQADDSPATLDKSQLIAATTLLHRAISHLSHKE